MAEYYGGMQSPFGAFTGGLFGGLRDSLQLFNAWEGLKQNRLQTQREQNQMNAAKAAQDALHTAGNGATNTALPSVTDTGAAPTAGNSGRDANGRPDLSTVPRPRFMQQPINVSRNVPLPGRKPTPPASQADVSSFERGSREGAAAPVSSAAATPAASTPQAQDPMAAAMGETVAAPFRAVGRGLAAVGRGALDIGSRVGQGMASGESYGMVPPANYLAPGSQGGAATVPTAPSRPPIGQPTSALPVGSTQPQAAAPPGAAPSLGQQQSQSLGQQIINAFTNANGF